MARNIFVYFVVASMLFTLPFISKSQTSTESLSQFSEEEFKNALSSYVKKLLVDFSEESIAKEKFLIALMRLVNHEMDNRIINRRAAIERYFNDLKSQLDELRQIKGRLKTAGISELDDYVDELEVRMKTALNSEKLDYKKKKVFEDALQLLYVAEEMIKLDQLSDPSNLNRKISRSKDKLLSAFGEVGELQNVPLDVAPTIFNLFNEWRKTESFQYSARLMDVKVARSNLLKSGSVENINRMFADHLKYAYVNFNDFDYELADRLLEDFIQTYEKAGVRDFEDVYYYWGESNFALSRLLRAQQIYNQFLEQYPNTAYLSRTYGRLIQISYKLERYEEVQRYFSIYQNVASPNEEEYYDNQFVIALSLYSLSDFNNAVEVLLSIPENNDFYSFSQYLIGNMYTAGQNYDLAIDVFNALLNSRKTPLEFRNRSYLKLAQINYERGAYQQAIIYVNSIHESFSRYDRVLNLLAWAHFMMEQDSQTESEQRDYTQAKTYALILLKDYYGSEHRMEAESLLGYIYQLENKLSLARNFYKNVYDSKTSRRSINEFLDQRDSLIVLYNQALEKEQEALRKENRDAYQLAASTSSRIQEQIWELDYNEISSVGVELSQEINDLLYQMDEMNLLKEKARATGNTAAMVRIDSLISRLRTSIEIIPEAYSKQAMMFSAYPVARRVANYEFNARKNSQIRTEILDEISQVDFRLDALKTEVERARFNDDFKKVVSLEQKIQKLLAVRKNYDQLYAESFELSPGEPYTQFDRWGDFGAVGIIDVDFGQRDRLQGRMANVSGLYNSIVDRISKRREVVEDQLKKIEAEIRFMTMKARLEERQRLRAEREQSFRETYFDTRTSEFEEK
jgi:tetratricopeptide (TPR) repeat protein